MDGTARRRLVAVSVALTACGSPTETFDTLSLTTSALEQALLDVEYLQLLRATGGDGNYVWSVASGSLPPGLDLSPANGRIQGTPTAVGNWTFGLLVSSGDGQSAERQLTIDVGYRPLVFTTTTLPAAVQGEPYSSGLAADGGNGSYAFSIVSGSLPDGIQLSASGELSGTPSSVTGETFEIEVRSGDGQTAVQEFQLGVHELLAVTTATLPDGTQSMPYDAFLSATGGDGTYSWSVTGDLPTGLALLATAGRILGTPTALQTASFTITVTSGDGQSAEADLSLTIGKLVLLPTDSCSDYPSTAIATFEDPALEAAVRAELGVAADADLTCATVAAPTSLAAASAGITSLTGIQNLSGLQQLYLVSNAIADLTYLGLLPSLEGVNLSHNLVSDLSPVGEIQSLTLLLAASNQITDIGPLGALTAMTHLYLSGNSIDDISALSGMVQMEILDLGDNAISDIGALSGMTKLSALDLAQNQVTDLTPLSGLHLETLALAGNGIADVAPLAGLVDLEFLHISSNSITDIGALGGLTRLNELFLESNQITDIAPLENLIQLQTLGLGFNASLADIQPLIDNSGLGAGDQVILHGTAVSCADVASLEARGVTVHSNCP